MSIRLVIVLLLTLPLCGCSQWQLPGISHSPCHGLVYGEGGIAKEKYLPCAEKILNTMANLDRSLEDYGAGNDRGRVEALHQMYDLRRLVAEAGGVKKLRSGWDDPRVRTMNDAMCDAYEVYGLETFSYGNPWKQLREYSQHNHNLAKTAAARARLYYTLAK